MNGPCQGGSSGVQHICRNITNSRTSRVCRSCLKPCGRTSSSPVSFLSLLLFAPFILLPLVPAANRIRLLFRLPRVPTFSFCGCMLCSRSCPHLPRHLSC